MVTMGLCADFARLVLIFGIFLLMFSCHGISLATDESVNNYQCNVITLLRQKMNTQVAALYL